MTIIAHVHMIAIIVARDPSFSLSPTYVHAHIQYVTVVIMDDQTVIELLPQIFVV